MGKGPRNPQLISSWSPPQKDRRSRRAPGPATHLLQIPPQPFLVTHLNTAASVPPPTWLAAALTRRRDAERGADRKAIFQVRKAGRKIYPLSAQEGLRSGFINPHIKISSLKRKWSFLFLRWCVSLQTTLSLSPPTALPVHY